MPELRTLYGSTKIFCASSHGVLNVKKIFLTLLTFLLVFFASFAVYVFRARQSEEVAFMNEPRYELGEHKGAEFCGACHQEIYSQWRNNSRHAVSTTAESVLDVQRELKQHTILNYMLGGEGMCHACHGPEAINDGVDCETCHGVSLPDTPIMEVHEKKFKPGRVEMRGEGFCAKCHEIPGFVTPYSDWQESEAAAENITCQGCHMTKTESGKAYHGFDTFVINEHAYDGDLSLDSISFDFPILELTINNHIRGHSVPAGGPTRLLALEVLFKDAEDHELHRDRETFAKYHSLIPVLGFWPNKIIADTQLKSGERRPVSFTLPSELEGQVKSVQLILRFYEVADEHEGDIEKAYFISEPFLQEVIMI
jgi:hypothetical protein